MAKAKTAKTAKKAKAKVGDLKPKKDPKGGTLSRRRIV